MTPRRSNPDSEKMVGYGLGALLLAGLGWIGYRAFASPASAPATPKDPLSGLPAFDASSKDVDHAYILSVFTTQPLPDVKITAEQAADVRAYLKGLPVDRITVAGPFDTTQKAVTDAEIHSVVIQDPLPDLALFVTMGGGILDGETKAMLQQMRDHGVGA